MAPKTKREGPVVPFFKKKEKKMHTGTTEYPCFAKVRALKECGSFEKNKKVFTFCKKKIVARVLDVHVKLRGCVSAKKRGQPFALDTLEQKK